MDPVNIQLPNLKFVALTVPQIIGGTQKMWAVPGYAHAPFSPRFLRGFCSDGPCKYPCQIWRVYPAKMVVKRQKYGVIRRAQASHDFRGRQNCNLPLGIEAPSLDAVCIYFVFNRIYRLVIYSPKYGVHYCLSDSSECSCVSKASSYQ